jgi:hypothetical protein
MIEGESISYDKIMVKTMTVRDWSLWYGQIPLCNVANVANVANFPMSFQVCRFVSP